jgi:hypothetical protein
MSLENNKDAEESIVVREFSDKFLKSQTDVPREIQEVINEHFFEML